MRLEGTYQFAAPRDVVWASLMDPAVLAQALPGGEQMERVADNEYRAAMNVRVGPVQGKFQGNIELADLLPPERYRLKVSGQGAPGFVNGEGELELRELDAGTELVYRGDVQIGGKIAGVSQRLIDSTAKSLTRQGLQALDQHIQHQLSPAVAIPAAAPVRSSPTTAAPVAAVSTADIAVNVAKDVAQDLAADFVPLEQQEKLFYAFLGALGMLLFVVLVRLVQKQ